MKELNYIADISLPNKSAYAVHVLKICDNFVKNGFRVNLNIYSRDEKYTFSKIKKNFLLKKKFKINHCYKSKCKRSFLNNVYFGLWCKKVINENSLIISRSIISAIILTLLKHNVVLEIHHEMSGFTKILYNIFSKLNFLNNLRFIFIHKNLQKIFDKKKKRSIVLDDCVEIEDFASKSNPSKRCVYTGSFTKGKGIELVIKLAKENPRIEFLAYGNLDTLNKIDTKSISNLKFNNYVPYNKIPSILKKNLVLLMPYQSKIGILAKNIDVSKYISPLKLFEYLAAANVIIASKLPVYSHILRNGYNCFLCKPNETKLWSKCIKKIFNNPKKFKFIMKNSLYTAKKYTWINRSKKIISFSEKQGLI